MIALVLALTGTAFAALGKNSVGSRQLKSKAVTTGKIANNAVNGAKVANGSLSGSDINLNALGTVPSATSAASAANANTLGGHAAACPAGTTLIRGVCFDSSPNPEAPSLEAATDACAARGGYLPTPMELYSVRGIINLGTGIGANHQYTDSYYYDPVAGAHPSTVTVDGTGAITQQAPTSPSRYTCVYPLVR
ncbi:MAG: hypothetical protein H0X42_04240 [Solirubrobacterales bacterium]|nr:hypothetical protein [Solirubrobacterales bacterium]